MSSSHTHPPIAVLARRAAAAIAELEAAIAAQDSKQQPAAQTGQPGQQPQRYRAKRPATDDGVVDANAVAGQPDGGPRRRRGKVTILDTSRASGASDAASGGGSSLPSPVPITGSAAGGADVLARPDTPGAASTASEEMSPLARPTIYPHAPREQPDSLDGNKWEATHVLDALRLESFEGLYNISALVLVFSLTYITVRNISQHGFFWHFYSNFTCSNLPRDLQLAAIAGAGMIVCALIVWQAQKWFYNHRIAFGAMVGTYIAIQVILFFSVVLMCYLTTVAPMIAAGMLLFVLIIMLKLHSFVATNYALHREVAAAVAARPKAKMTFKVCNLHHFLYFLACPSLVYETAYPRSPSIRWRFVFNRLMKLAFCFLIQVCIAGQFLLPVLSGRRSNHYMIDMMKLAVPSMLLWLSGFYMMFHCQLNIVAELLRFSDRNFFRDWWNSTSVDAFWSKWNTPVHEWCLRHVYVETQHYAKVTKHVATLATFLLSAVLHEVLFSVSFKTFRPWFFLGMLLQVPLIAFSRHFRGTRLGNFIMWWSLFSGQPLLETLYFREWFTEHDGFVCMS